MSSKSLLHQAKLNEWISRFADQKASGFTVVEWCKQNNLSEYKYFYWKRLLKEKAIEQVLPDIVPLAMPSVQPGITQVIPNKTEVASESCASCTSFTSNSCSPYLKYYCYVGLPYESFSVPSVYLTSLWTYRYKRLHTSVSSEL